jgi:hypothetical protein
MPYSPSPSPSPSRSLKQRQVTPAPTTPGDQAGQVVGSCRAGSRGGGRVSCYNRHRWVAAARIRLAEASDCLPRPPDAGSWLTKPPKELALWNKIHGMAVRRSTSGPPITGWRAGQLRRRGSSRSLATQHPDMARWPGAGRQHDARAAREGGVRVSRRVPDWRRDCPAASRAGLGWTSSPCHEPRGRQCCSPHDLGRVERLAPRPKAARAASALAPMIADRLA